MIRRVIVSESVFFTAVILIRETILFLLVDRHIGEDQTLQHPPFPMTNKYHIAVLATVLSCFPGPMGRLLAQVNPNKPPSAESGASMPSSSKLSPEERQQRKQAKMQKEMDEEMRRIEVFGMVPESDTSPLAVSYRQSADEFRRATADFSDSHARLEYRLEENLTDAAREKWLSDLKNSHEKMVLWRNRGAELYASDPEKYESVGLMLREMLIADGKLDRLDRWVFAARSLLSSPRLIDDEVLLYAGYTGFLECDFELASMGWGQLAEAGKLPEREQYMLSEIPAISKTWEKELVRLQEDAAKDNPRVEIVTTKGVMEVELFEDDAPESVANFIYLVENGYYNRKPIFMVRQHFLAQTGCEKGDGKGNSGYTIKGEFNLPSHRSHFRGSLAIPLALDTTTNEINPNSGGAQFYFSFLPTPIFDGKHTVFGRVASGIETLGLFKVVNLTDEEERKNPESNPDVILRAKVLKKRDHAYRPTPVIGRLPK